MTTDDEVKKAAEEYEKNCDWSYNLYGDKSDMPWEEQKKYPSDIPANIKLAFIAGATWQAARDKAEIARLRENLKDYKQLYDWAMFILEGSIADHSQKESDLNKRDSTFKKIFELELALEKRTTQALAEKKENP